MNVSMGTHLRDYVDMDAVEALPTSDSMQQYANSVVAIFMERCEDHVTDPNRMWHRLRHPEDELRSMYHRGTGVPEAGEQLRYQAVHQLHTQSA